MINPHYLLLITLVNGQVIYTEGQGGGQRQRYFLHTCCGSYQFGEYVLTQNIVEGELYNIIPQRMELHGGSVGVGIGEYCRLESIASRRNLQHPHRRIIHFARYVYLLQPVVHFGYSHCVQANIVKPVVRRDRSGACTGQYTNCLERAAIEAPLRCKIGAVLFRSRGPGDAGNFINPDCFKTDKLYR